MDHRALSALLAAIVLGSCTTSREPTAPSPSMAGGSPLLSEKRPDLPGTLQLVGHEPLFNRGMNSAIAIAGDRAYVGSRTDGSQDHPHAGILVVDIHDPSRPRVVDEIGPPDAGNPAETSRELRVWPARDLLLVMSFRCDPVGHDCDRGPVTPAVRFFDIRGNRPTLVATYRPSVEPHEFFLWQDPTDSHRALLFMSTTSLEDNLVVADISKVGTGRVREVAIWHTTFPDPGTLDGLRSLSVSPDGRQAYLAFLTVGFLVLDTSELAEGRPDPHIRLLTRLETRPQWEGWGAHSAVKIPGRDLVLTTDETYGRSAGGGCPWGWARLIDVADEAAPRILAEYRVHPYNDPSYCAQVDPDRDADANFSSHNPTVTEHLALVSWHSAGLQVFSTDDPARPEPLAEFVPEPLASVATEDPGLTEGPDKVAMWSYPVVKDGLIYVVDVRNGLYVLRYEGPYAAELRVEFLEGNSNLSG